MAVVTRLEIFNKDGSGLQSQPFNDNIPVSLNFNLADVREPDKRKASRSLTISIDASNEINKCFENIFEVNIATQYFNKNLKTPCKYFVNEILNFEGSLQLLKIVKRPDNSMVYECSIIGEGGSLFVEIGEKLIVGNANSSEDLDFSDYDHTYNRATQISTRSNYGTGLDVVYPFIDKGSNGGSDTVWNTTDFLPCFHLREYIEKIITKAGYTFTSSILDSAEFKKYIVYPNLTSIPLSQSQLDNRQFYVGLTSNSVRTANSTWSTVNYPNETSGDGFFDDGSQSAGTYVIINDSGYYNIAAADYYRISFTHTDPSVVKAQMLYQHGKRIRKSGNGGVGWFNLSAENFNNFVGASVSNPKMDINTYYYFTNQVATGEQFLTAGDYLEAQSYLRSFGVTYYDASNNIISTGTGTVTIELISGASKTSFYALATRKELIAGNTLLAQNALPTKIKQKDLLISIVKALNLYIDLDPDDKTNLIIESFDTFYNTLPILNYEGKTDEDKEKTVNVNILDSKRYIFKYKEDKDKFNEQYKNTWNEVFGSEQIDIENDFSKNDKVTEIIFSPTPNAANYGLGIAHPRIYKEEQSGGVTVKKPIVPNIRLLVCGGVKQTANTYTYKDFGNADLITNDYLYAGHTDDPFNPTIDLNFGLPKEVYYTYVNTYFTTNNFYNRFHKYYIENLTNRDSKFETKYLWLNSKDINEFNFRRRIFSDGAYWIVNKIENYTPLNETSTKFELVKLLTANVFTPESRSIIESETVSSGIDVSSARMNTSLNVGNSNQILGTNCLAIGENIIIPESCTNVTIVGNNITVEEGVSNFTGININDRIINSSLSGQTLTESFNANEGIRFIYTVNDFPEPVSSVITLEDELTYFICGNVDLDGNIIQCGVNNAIIGGSSENCRLKTTLEDAEPMISSNYSLALRNITLEAQLAIELDGDGTTTALDWFGVNFTDCKDIGFVSNYTNFIMSDCASLNSGALNLYGTIGTFGVSNSLFSTRTGEPQIVLKSTLTISRRFRIIYSSFVVPSTSEGIIVQSGASIPTESYILDTVNFSGAGTYLTGLDHTSNDSLFINCKGIINTAVNGQLYMQGNATATVVSATNTFYKVLGTTTASSDNSKFSHSNNRLTCDAIISRKYLIQCFLSFTAGNGNVCEFGFYDSQLAAVRTPSKTKSTANASGRAENVGFACVLTMESGDYLEIHASNTSASTNITVDNMNFVITEIK